MAYASSITRFPDNTPGFLGCGIPVNNAVACIVMSYYDQTLIYELLNSLGDGGFAHVRKDLREILMRHPDPE